MLSNNNDRAGATNPCANLDGDAVLRTSGILVPFSNRTLLTERQWRQAHLDTLHQRGGDLANRAALAAPGCVSLLHSETDTPGEAPNHE